MASNNEYFTPERVDEQIEQLHQAKPLDEATDEAQLVNMLRRSYQTRLVAEDRAALERARQRITGAQCTVNTSEHAEPIVILHPPGPVVHTTGRRLSRILSGLAAVIVIGALLGGWLAVTRMMRTSPTAPSSEPSDLYVVQNGIAYRFDGRSGKVIWQDHLSTSEQSGSTYLQVVNGVAYTVIGFDVYALDARNGAQIWHITNRARKGYFWFVVDNGRLYLFSLDYTFSALNAANGSELWHNTTFTTENGYGFSVQNGNLYTQNSGANQLDALNSATGQVRWQAPLPDGSLLGAPLVENGIVYAAGGSVYALKEQSGQRIWKKTLPGGGIDMYAGGILYVDSPVVTLQAATSSGTNLRNIYALDARTGRLLWTSDPGYNTLNLPITDGLLLAAREYNGVYSLAGLDPRTGRAAWQVPFQCAVSTFDRQTQPTCSSGWTAVIGGKLYLLEAASSLQGKTTYTLKSFNPGTGQLLSAHQLTIGQQNVQALGASNGLLYLQTSVPQTANGIPYADYFFVAYHLSDGSLAWSHAMPPFPPPTSADTTPNTSSPVLAP